MISSKELSKSNQFYLQADCKALNVDDILPFINQSRGWLKNAVGKGKHVKFIQKWSYNQPLKTLRWLFLADSDLETRKIMFLEFKVTIQEDWDIAKSEGK